MSCKVSGCSFYCKQMPCCLSLDTGMLSVLRDYVKCCCSARLCLIFLVLDSWVLFSDGDGNWIPMHWIYAFVSFDVKWGKKKRLVWFGSRWCFQSAGHRLVLSPALFGCFYLFYISLPWWWIKTKQWLIDFFFFNFCHFMSIPGLTFSQCSVCLQGLNKSSDLF